MSLHLRLACRLWLTWGLSSALSLKGGPSWPEGTLSAWPAQPQTRADAGHAPIVTLPGQACPRKEPGQPGPPSSWTRPDTRYAYVLYVLCMCAFVTCPPASGRLPCPAYVLHHHPLGQAGPGGAQPHCLLRPPCQPLGTSPCPVHVVCVYVCVCAPLSPPCQTLGTSPCSVHGVCVCVCVCVCMPFCLLDSPRGTSPRPAHVPPGLHQPHLPGPSHDVPVCHTYQPLQAWRAPPCPPQRGLTTQCASNSCPSTLSPPEPAPTNPREGDHSSSL